MLYKQAQEGIAKEIRTPLWFLNCAFPKIFNSSLDIADYSDKSLEISKILAVIFTPEEIEEWKKGGYPAIVCKDQSLPLLDLPNIDLINLSLDRAKYYGLAKTDMAGFRRVRGGEG